MASGGSGIDIEEVAGGCGTGRGHGGGESGSESDGGSDSEGDGESIESWISIIAM
jgi:hypothetical protein